MWLRTAESKGFLLDTGRDLILGCGMPICCCRDGSVLSESVLTGLVLGPRSSRAGGVIEGWRFHTGGTPASRNQVLNRLSQARLNWKQEDKRANTGKERVGHNWGACLLLTDSRQSGEE